MEFIKRFHVSEVKWLWEDLVQEWHGARRVKFRNQEAESDRSAKNKNRKRRVTEVLEIALFEPSPATTACIFIEMTWREDIERGQGKITEVENFNGTEGTYARIGA